MRRPILTCVAALALGLSACGQRREKASGNVRAALPGSSTAGQVVEIRAPDGRRRYLWAAPGDLIYLDKSLPFPFRYRGSPRLHWEREGDLVRVNGRITAVDLSFVPVSQMSAVAAAASQGGARCAFWRGRPNISKAEVQALSRLPQSCLGVRLEQDVADGVLARLAPLAPRLHLLDAIIHRRGSSNLIPFTALRVLVIRPGRQQEPEEKGTTSAWKNLRGLMALVDLRAKYLEPEAQMMPTLRRLSRLRRLEIRSVSAANFVELTRKRGLASLAASISSAPAGLARPGQARKSDLRELHSSTQGSWGKLSRLRWLQGLSALRILDFQHEPQTDAPDFRGFSHLELLQADCIASENGPSRLPPSIRILQLRSLTSDESSSIPTDLLRGLPHLEHLSLSSEKLRGKRSQVLRAATSLKSFGCAHCDLDDAALATLATLTRLTDLDVKLGAIYDDLEEPGITRAGLAHLGKLVSLRRLALARTPVDDELLARLSRLTELRRLDLAHTIVSDAGLKHLGGLRHLQWLSLRDTRITSAGVTALRSLSRLRHLDLSATGIDDQALTVVARLVDLRWLSLEATQLTGTGLKRLQALRRLQVLKLGHATLDGGVLAREGLPPDLLTLEVSAIPLSAQDVLTVSRLSRVHTLWLVNCALRGESLRTLSRMARLRKLIAAWNDFVDADIAHLDPPATLRMLVVRPSDVTIDAVKIFERAHPRLSATE